MKNRSIQLIANVEPELSNLVWAMVRERERSMSTYLRTLIINDMKSKGLLTSEMMEEML